jgi:hypothetical protein
MTRISGVERDEFFIEAVKNGHYSVSKEGDIFNTRTNKKVAANSDCMMGCVDGKPFSITKLRAIWLTYRGSIGSADTCVVLKNEPMHLDNLVLMDRKDLNSSIGKRAVTKLNNKASSKFTDKEILDLRHEFVRDPKSFFLRKRAKELGVSHATLSFALKGKTYKHVADPVSEKLLYKPGGNSKSPSIGIKKKNNTPKKVKERASKVQKSNVIPFNPKPVIAKTTEGMTEQQKQDRLEMMKRIGKRLNKIRE